jgi:two-component system chemotaxis response regulator CheY
MATVANAEVIKRLVILIADSKIYSRALLRSMLLHLEVTSIHEVIDGAAVLDAFVTVNPDVMILDWDLPVLSVQEVLNMARSSNANPNPDLPIIVVSSCGLSAQVREAIQLGAQHFMVWPISPKRLQQRLLRIVADARKTALAYKQTDPPVMPDSEPWRV